MIGLAEALKQRSSPQFLPKDVGGTMALDDKALAYHHTHCAQHVSLH
jgi:hypothetical protein